MAHNIGIFTALVNGDFTGCDVRAVRPYYRMDLKGLLTRIEQRLEALKVSATAASAAAGRPDAIRNLRRKVEAGRSGSLNAGTLDDLARVLKTSSEWLKTGEGAEEADRGVPLVGYVGAGGDSIVRDGSHSPDEFVDRPDGATSETVAAEIRGTSLGELFDRWLVYYDDVRSPVTGDLIGKLCVVGLSDGQILIKKLKRGAEKGLYNLFSNTEPTIYAVKVDWAAKVNQMRPR